MGKRHRVPIQMIPVECVPGNAPELGDDSANEMRGDVLETVCSLLVYLSVSPRPAVLLDALAVVTGLILTDAQTAKLPLSQKARTQFRGIREQHCGRLATPKFECRCSTQSGTGQTQVARPRTIAILPGMQPTRTKPATVNPVPYQAHAGES